MPQLEEDEHELSSMQLANAQLRWAVEMRKYQGA
jgi:hypothetical protein